MDRSCVDRVLKDLTICGSKPIKEVIKAIMPENITIDTFSSAQTNEIRFKGWFILSAQKAPLMYKYYSNIGLCDMKQ